MKVVGLGPGGPGLLPPEAVAALEEAQVVVGYSSYLKYIDPGLLAAREVISTGMKKEIDRCRAAVDMAAQGRRTVLVSSGDPGVYGMAGLALEIVERAGLADRLEVEIIPGIPALCAAAARLGAPLMHDFAVVSLSDLMTPWELIQKRVAAALDADFVLVLYNPRSRRRTFQLSRVKEMIISMRGENTYAGIVRNAARQGESVLVTTIKDMDESRIDMLTIIVVGNSSTKYSGKWMITPRGYLEKYRIMEEGKPPGV